MIRNQFEIANREDITIQLTKPASCTGLLAEIQRLPGVVKAEALRQTGFRIIHRQLDNEILVTGIDSKLSMRRVPDHHCQPIPVLPGDFLLSRRLAGKMGIYSGDLITLQEPEGQRRLLSVRITGLSDDMLGKAGYLTAPDLQKLLGEANKCKMVLIRSEAIEKPGLISRLKSRPGEASVSVKDFFLTQFRKTSLKFLLFFAFVLTGFAVIIASGVMFNTARIILSERSWELASLRILGFGPSQVFRLLLAELALSILLATPLGCFWGYSIAKVSVNLTASDSIALPMTISFLTYATGFLVILLSAAISVLMLGKKALNPDLASALKVRD